MYPMEAAACWITAATPSFPLSPLPDRPLDLLAGPDGALELLALRDEVVGPDEGRAAPVGPPDGGDRRRGQVGPRVQFRDLGVVPGRDLALENAGQHLTRELQL